MSSSGSRNIIYQSKLRKKADERDEIQKKTFTKWMNRYLIKSGCRVKDLYEDLRDGNNLISLLEILTQCKLRRERGLLRIHRLQNVNTALAFLTEDRRIKLVNIRSDDIVDGNPKLTLGLIWSIILSLQVDDIVVVNDEGDNVAAKAGLMIWARRHVEGYDTIDVNNFTTSWRDGKVFSAIINRHRPDLIDMEKMQEKSNYENLQNAFRIAEEELGVSALLDPEDVDLDQPDERSIITYVSALFKIFPKVPPKPKKITFLEEYTEKLENFVIARNTFRDWLNSQQRHNDNDNDVITHTTNPDDLENMKKENEEFRDGELKDKQSQLKELEIQLKNLQGLREKMKDNKEDKPEGGDVEGLDGLRERFNVLLNQVNQKNVKISRQANRLKRKKAREEKLRRKMEKIEDFKEEHLSELFMPATHVEISDEIQRLKSLQSKLSTIANSDRSSMTSLGITTSSASSSSESLSSSSSDSDADSKKRTANGHGDSPTTKHGGNKQLDLRVEKLQNKLDKNIEQLEKGLEYLEKLDTECGFHLEWLQQPRIKSLLRHHRNNDVINDVEELKSLMREIDQQREKTEVFFRISADFNENARDYDDVISDITTMTSSADYQRRASQRMTIVQQQSTDIVSQYSQLRTNIGGEIALQNEMEEAINRDRESSCKSAVEILVKFEHEINKNQYLEISKIDKQIQLFKQLDMEIPSHEPTFSAMKDKIPDMSNTYVIDTSRSDVMTSRLMELLGSEESVTIQQICDRWQLAKEITKERLKWLLVARAKLLFINGEVETHSDWLKQNEDKFQQITTSHDYDVTPSKLADQVQQIKKFKSCLDIRIGQIKSNLHQNLSQFIEASTKFHQDTDGGNHPQLNGDSNNIDERYSDVQNKVDDLISDHEKMKSELELRLEEKEKQLTEVRTDDVRCIMDAYRVLRQCEQQLVEAVPFPCVTPQFEQYLDNLKTLQEEIEENDGKFERELPQRFADNLEVRLLDIYDPTTDDDTVMLDAQSISVEEIIERWTVVRNQIQPRMKRISEGKIELDQLKPELSQHEHWLASNESRSTITLHVDVNAKKINSTQSMQEITRFKEFQAEVKERISMTSSMQEYVKSMERTARSYDRDVYKYISSISDNNNADEDYEDLINNAAKQRYYDVYAQVSKITARYTELLKLITSNIERLQSMNENARKREAQICKRAYALLRDRERHLDDCDVIEADVDELENTRKLLQELRDETSVNDPAFTTMQSHCPVQDSSISSLYAPHHISSLKSDDDVDVVERSIPDDLTCNDITLRWNQSKDQTKERLKLVMEAQPILSELMNKLHKHQQWLDRKEPSIPQASKSSRSSSLASSDGNGKSDTSSSSSSNEDETDLVDGEKQAKRNKRKRKRRLPLKRSVSQTKKMKDDTEKLLSELSDRISDSGELLEAKNRLEEKSNKFKKLVEDRNKNKQEHNNMNMTSSSSSSDSDVIAGGDNATSGNKKKNQQNKKRRTRRKRKYQPNHDLTSEVADVINRYESLRTNASQLHKQLQQAHDTHINKQLACIAACLRHLHQVDEQHQLHPCMPVTCHQLDDLLRHLHVTSQSHDDASDDFEQLKILMPDPHAHLMLDDDDGHVRMVDGVRVPTDVTSGQILQRWEKAKQKTQDRIKLANLGHEKLTSLEPEVQEHIKWLDEHQADFDNLLYDDDDDTDDDDCVDHISDQLQQTKNLQKEIKKRLEKSLGMYQLTGEYDEAGRKYFLLNTTNNSLPAADNNHVENVEEESKRRMEYVEKKVKEIVKKYEELSKTATKSCKKQQEKLEMLRIQQIDDARIAEEKEKILEDWMNNKERELDGWNVESGLCDTVLRQLQQVQNMESELEAKKEEMISLHGVVAVIGSSTDHPMAERLARIQQVIDERKNKLNELLEDAQNFEIDFDNFQSWLETAENYLKKERERTIRTTDEDDLKERFDDITTFENDINKKRTDLLDLESLASKIRYFAARQDSLGVKNKMLSLRGRWDKLVPSSNELFNKLDNLLKLLQNFNVQRSDMMIWCEQTGCDVTDAFGEPDSLQHSTIVDYVARHDAYVDEMKVQKVEYEKIMKQGKTLHEKSVVKEDKEILTSQLDHLKQCWRNLEDDLRMARDNVDDWVQFSSHLYTVIESLRSWLLNTENDLNSNGRISGDLHTVQFLLDQHQKIRNGLRARCENLEKITSTIQENKTDDQWSEQEIKKLSDLWDSVAELIRIRQEGLEEAFDEATKLHEDCDEFIDRIQSISGQCEQVLMSSSPHNTDQLKKLESIHEQNAEDLEKEKEVMFELNEKIAEMLERSYHKAVPHLQDLLTKLEQHYDHAANMNDEVEKKLKKHRDDVVRKMERLDHFYEWLERVAVDLKEKEQENNLEDLTTDQLDKLCNEHEDLQKRLTESQSEYDVITSKPRHNNKMNDNSASFMNSTSSLADDASTTSSTSTSSSSGTNSNTNNNDQMDVKIHQLQTLWKRVWFASLERQKRLQDAKEHRRKNLSPEEEAAERKFFEDWRQRYMKWKKSRKLRMMDLFRSVDTDQTGRLTHEQFSNNIIKSSFKTTPSEMQRVCNIFDRDGDGYIDYYEFISALYPSKDKSAAPHADDDEYVEDEVCRQVSSCKCCKKYFVERVKVNKPKTGNNKQGLMFQYRFGDSHQMRLVRVLSSVVMVRIGGGWQALEEFLQKNDPCRAKGRTNVEIHEKMILPAGASQSMTPFRRSRRPTTAPNIGESNNNSSTPQRFLNGHQRVTTAHPPIPRPSFTSPRHTITSPLAGSTVKSPNTTTTSTTRNNNNNNKMTTATTTSSPNHVRATISAGSSPLSTSQSRLVAPKARKTRQSLNQGTSPNNGAWRR